MIKFFRKIRHRLLTENKFSKYLIYAIGEIILVVIGILIALQINNAHNYNEQRKIEQKYLLSLQAEFKNNLGKLTKEMQENRERIDATNELLPLFDKSISDTVSSEAIAKLFSTIFGTSLTFEPSSGVLTDIISSGKLELLQNEKLRELLASFEGSMGFYKLQEKVANSVKTDLQKLYYKKGSVRNIMKSFGREFEYQSISENTDVKELFNSVEFENYLLDYLMTSEGANNDDNLNGLKKEIEEISHEINEDLNK